MQPLNAVPLLYGSWLCSDGGIRSGLLYVVTKAPLHRAMLLLSMVWVCAMKQAKVSPRTMNRLNAQSKTSSCFVHRQTRMQILSMTYQQDFG